MSLMPKGAYEKEMEQAALKKRSLQQIMTRRIIHGTKKLMLKAVTVMWYSMLETETVRKYLRNTSTAEKVTRFKRRTAVFQELCKNPIPNVVEVTDVYIDEDKIAESYVEMKKI